MYPILVETNLPRDGKSDAARRVRSVTINLAESPLGWLKARGLVSDRQFAAGELLRTDFEAAQLSPRVTMCWNSGPMDRKPQARKDPGADTFRQITAKDRFAAAIDHAGPGLSDILWRVICAGEPMPSAEKAMGWPTRAGRIVLTLALDRIADYYRVA
jgi:Domain of unknown function (DUF6456)